MSSVQKSNVPFYDLINILGDQGTFVLTNAKMFAQGLIGSYKKKEAKSFEKTLINASKLLKKEKITAIQFLNFMASRKHDNQIITENWIENSRIDCLPEVEYPNNDAAVSEEENSDSEDSSDSENE